MRNLLRVLVLGLTACLVDLAIAGDYVSLEKVTHFSCSGQDGPDNYVVDVTKVGKHIYNVRASQVEDGVARLVFKMKAAYKTFPVYWYDHEWLDTNTTYGSPNAPTLLNRLFISQGPHLGPFAGKLTIESFPGFEDRTFIYVRCDI